MTSSLLLFKVAQDALKFSLFEINGSDTPLLYGSIRSTPIGFIFRVKVASTRLTDLVVLSPFADIGLAAIYVASWVTHNYKSAALVACVHQQSNYIGDQTCAPLGRLRPLSPADPELKAYTSLDLVTAALWQHYPGIRQFHSTTPYIDPIPGADRPGRNESDIALSLSAQFFTDAKVYA